MSDDFDKLRPTGDEDDSEDESLDWKQDKSKKPGQPASGSDLGFTGELNWRKDVDDAFSEQMAAANEDAFDWQQKQQDKGSSGPSSSGYTGELDWKKAQQSGGGDMPNAGADDDSLDWLRNADEGESAPADADDDPFANLTPAQPQQPEVEDDPLAWMDQYGTNASEDERAESAQSFMDEDEDIFATAPDQLDMPDDQNDPLSWLNQFSATDETPPEPTSTASAPSWLDDDVPEAQQDSGAAAPSWLDEPEDIVPDDMGDADMPPWLSDDVPTEKPITEGGKLSADWLAGAEDAPDSAEADMSFDDWQRIQNDLTRPRDLEEEMPDLFSEMSGTPPVSDSDLPANDTGQLPSWVLGMDELNDDNAPDWMTQDQPEPTSSTPVPDDIFAELGLPSDDDPLAGLNLGGSEDTPDWLQESAPSAASPAAPSASGSDDIFSELGISAPATGYDFLDNPVDDDDPLAGLNLGGSDDSPDWFAEAEQPAANENDAPNWLQDLGDLSEAAEATTMDMGAGAGIAPAEDDFLAELRGASRQPADIDPTDTSGLQDIDSLLASYDDAMALPDTGELMGGGDNIMDRLLSNEDLEQISARRAPDANAHPSAGTSGLSPDAPEWLTELGANVDEVSAAAIVRKQTQRERPLDELTDRLQALHDRGLEMPTSEENRPSEVLRTLLPGVTEVLPAAPLQVIQSGFVGDLVLTGAQREKINLLKSLVGTDEDERRPAKASAIDLTLDTPNLADLDIDEGPDFGTGTDAQAAPLPAAATVRARKSRRLLKIDRLLIAIFLAVAVILPYVVNSLRIGDLPPAQFAAGSREATAFTTVDGLHRGDLALIAAEYGPTGAGELDPILDALLRHTLMRGARPVIVSGNPVGLLHARNVLNKILADTGFLRLIDRPSLHANRDYYVVRYLAASTIGLRAFSQDLPQMLAVDVDGQATNLGTQSIQEFAVIAVIAESAEELRGWAEQVAPMAGKPLVAATGQSAAPLSEPYVLAGSPQVLSGLSGLLVGYKDAYTYRSMLDARLTGADSAPIPTVVTPAEIPTTVIPETPSNLAPTVEGGAAAESTSEISGTAVVASPSPEGAQPTTTVPPTATEQLTNTPGPTSTPTNTPKPTFTPSITPTFEPAVNVRGVIDSDQGVNVREGPGRTFAPIASLSPGTIVQITGRNGDGTWLKVKMDDGTEGWVSASLVGVEAPPQTTEEATQTGMNIDLNNQVAGLISDFDVYAPALQDTTPAPETTVEAGSVEATAEVPVENTAEPTAAPTADIPALPAATPYRDERWYGMTLGLVAIIVVITIGMIVNIVRGLFRRGK